MKLSRINPNRPDPVQLAYTDGTMLLFSYEVPVAAYLPGESVYLVTDMDVTPTTARRIEEWVKDRPRRYVPQGDIFSVITARPLLTR